MNERTRRKLQCIASDADFRTLGNLNERSEREPPMEQRTTPLEFVDLVKRLDELLSKAPTTGEGKTYLSDGQSFVAVEVAPLLEALKPIRAFMGSELAIAKLSAEMLKARLADRDGTDAASLWDKFVDKWDDMPADEAIALLRGAIANGRRAL